MFVFNNQLFTQMKYKKFSRYFFIFIIIQGKKKNKKKGSANPPGANFTKLRKFLLKYAKFFSEKEPENVAIIACTN